MIFVLLLALIGAPVLSEGAHAEGASARVEGRVDGQADQIPELTAAVNDFAGIIDASSKDQLDALSRKLKSATGDVITVATVKTFQPYGDLKSYAVKMFENHGKGIGDKGKDNGVLIVIALDDRDVWIETGYGIEGFITDGFSGETSRAMTPYFRNGDYGQGLLFGATRVAQRIAEGRGVNLDLAPLPQQAEPRSRRGRIPIGFWVVLFIIIMNTIGRKRRRRRWISGVGPFGGGFGGGGFGGGGFGGGGFGGFGGGRSGGGGGGASW